MSLPLQLGFAKSPRTADAIAASLRVLLNADGAALLQQQLQSQSGGVVSVERHDPTDTMPAWAVCFHPEWTLVLISGCQTITQAVNTAAGYLVNRTTLNLSERTENPYFGQVALPIWQRLQGNPTTQNQPLTIAGHSLGGCVAQEVAWALRTQQLITNNVQVTTFGSPKWSWRWKQEQLASTPVRRWMNDTDPVPLFPPSSNDFPSLLLRSSVLQLVSLARYTQAEGGVVISPNGHMVSEHYPPLNAVEWSVATGTWLWQWDSAQDTSPHSLVSYRENLQANLALDLPPRDDPRGTQRIAPTTDTSRVNVTRQEQRVEQQLIAAEARQRDFPIRLPPANLVHVRRNGNVHLLLWNDETIAVVVRRRSALSLARDCNRFLRHLLHGGLVEPDAITQQLATYLANAQDPTSGITPLLNTQLPPE